MNRHPYSGSACTFCSDPNPAAPQHIKGDAVVDGNHALLCGGIAGAIIAAAHHLSGYVNADGPVTDSEGNYLDTFTITMKSGKYDVTVRPQQ